jgi:glycerol uptake facilitator-like aquaporin
MQRELLLSFGGREDFTMQFSLAKRSAAEALGTAILVATVVGSGIMADRLCNGNVAIALLANTIATGAVLLALILALGPISGAHFNPAVTIADAMENHPAGRVVAAYLGAQFAGGIAGTVVAHLMFDLPLYSLSTHVRHGRAQGFSEFVATFGLVAVIWGCSRLRAAATPYAVACYIVAGYWFTASTCFANPAVAVARALTNTFAGIRPVDVPWFILAEIMGAVCATLLFRWLVPATAATPEVSDAYRAEPELAESRS